MPTATPPAISLIIPTFNRRDRLARLLEALDDAVETSPPFEVIVVVDGAKDGTVEMLHAARTAFPLRVLEQTNQGPAAARNRGIAAAEAPLVLFIDDDVIPVEGLIERHVRWHAETPRAVVIGPMIPPPDLALSPWIRWEAERLERQYRAMIAGEWKPTARQFYTANASLRRNEALAAGGFDARFKRAEDVEFAYRLADRGMQFFFDAQAAVLHDPGRSFEAWMKVPYEYGRYDVVMARDGGRAWLLRVALNEWKLRKALNRLFPRLCVGHAWRSRVLLGLLTTAVRIPLPDRLMPIQVALCSPIFSIQYWQGIADTSGVGANPWAALAVS